MKLKDIERAALMAANLQQAEEALQSFTGRNRPYNCSEIRAQVRVQAIGGDHDTKELARFTVSEDELKALLGGRISTLRYELSKLGIDVDGLPAPTVSDLCRTFPEDTFQQMHDSLGDDA